MSPTPAPSDPESVFASWAEEAERGGLDGAPSFDSVVEAHPVHADTLRRMYADWLHFAPLLARVVPGLMASEVGLGELPLPSGTDESAQPVTPELLDRLGIQVPDSGRYRFRGVLGQGGGGVVLRVWDQKLQRPLAMKVVLGPSERRAGQPRAGHETPPVDATVLTRFVDEARIASQLDHPSIVPVHELGTDSTGRAYFTMRLVRGRDLHRILEARREGDAEWNEPRLLGILAKACEAVAYAHERGVVHRDLKPSNIMVGRHGEVHVMDWGLARVQSAAAAQAAAAAGSTSRPAAPMPSAVRTVRSAERDTTPGSPLLTGAGAALGTPAYMAPEQARGEHALVDARADVYALGSILYEVLGGTPPFVPRGAKVDAGLIYLRLLEGPPRPLRELAPRTPEQLLAITERAMAREPADRYPDVRALENDLRAYLERRVVKAYETGVWAETKQWLRRNPGLACGLALGSIASLVGTLAYKNAADRANRSAVEAAASLEASRSSAYAASIRHAASSIELRRHANARRALDEAPVELRRWEWHYLDAIHHSKEIAKFRGAAACMSTSNQLLALGLEDGSIELRRADDGSIVARLPCHARQIRHIEFSNDDRLLLSESEDDWMSICDLRTGLEVARVPSLQSSTSSRHLSPDGRHFAFAPDASEIVVQELASGKTVYRSSTSSSLEPHFTFIGPRQLLTQVDDSAIAIAKIDSIDLPVRFQHEFSFSEIAVNCEDMLVIAKDERGSVSVWNARDGSLCSSTPIGYLDDRSHQLNVCKGTLIANTPQGIEWLELPSLTLLGRINLLPRQHFCGVDTSPDRSSSPWIALCHGTEIVVHDLATGREKTRLTGSDTYTDWIIGRADGGSLLSATISGVFHLWDCSQASPLAQELRVGPFQDWTPRHCAIWAVSNTGELIEIDLITGQHHTLPLADSIPLRSIDCPPDGDECVIVGRDGVARMLSACGAIRVIGCPDGRYRNAVLSPCGTLVALSQLGSIEVFDPSSTEQLASLCQEPSEHRPASAVLSRSGMAVSWFGAFDNVPKVWDLRTGTLLGLLDHHSDSVMAVAFSPDGLTVATASWDRTAVLWNAETLTPIVTLHHSSLLDPHPGLTINSEDWVHAACFTIDGDRVVTGAYDGKVRVFDVKSGRELLQIQPFQGEISAINVDKSGQFIIAQRRDGHIVSISSLRHAERIELINDRSISRASTKTLVDSILIKAGSIEAAIDQVREQFSYSEELSRIALEYANAEFFRARYQMVQGPLMLREADWIDFILQCGSSSDSNQQPAKAEPIDLSPSECNARAWSLVDPDRCVWPTRDESLMAVTLATHAVQAVPQPAYIDTLAHAYYFAGRFPDAIRYQRMAVALTRESTDSEVAENLDQLEARIGQLFDAAGELRHLELNSRSASLRTSAEAINSRSVDSNLMRLVSQ